MEAQGPKSAKAALSKERAAGREALLEVRARIGAETPCPILHQPQLVLFDKFL